MALPEPVCIGCSQRANQILEYIHLAEDAGTNPSQWVRAQEGTYNPLNGHFACTDCYYRMGCPSSPRGWRAP